MGNLVFIGLGLHDEKGITLRGIEAIWSSDAVYMEAYTSTLTGAGLEDIESLCKKKVTVLDRKAVEDGSVIIDKAKEARVAFLVPGDVMSATTHIDLRLRANKEGITTQIIHGVSALTAVPGILGLQAYKFGKVTTIPYWQDNYKPSSFMDVIKDNISMGLHTLLLLDIREDEGRYMTATEAFEILAEADVENTLTERLICVVARAGSPDVLASARTFSELAGMDFGKPLHSIVIPGDLHFMEAEALIALAGAPENIQQ